ncbi:MAG: hypothetical protein HY738_18160, partial [Bacteroidia bacterium]|nr:hypothetical protein [Bacteroidia bacterium]
GSKYLEKNAETDESGIQYIRFILPARLKSNDGLLNILIDYQGQTEAISRTIPIVLNKIKFTMYPEGGDLVYGLKSKLAFKALNEFGKPADVQGIVFNQDGNKVADFSSFHQGIGAFEIKPVNGNNYHVKITKPEGIDTVYDLPEPLERGYVLAVGAQKNDVLEMSVHSTETEQISLVAQVRGKIYYSNSVNINKGENNMAIPVNDFPAGIAQITLFDAKGIERAERLAFVNKHKQLNISIETDKEKYLPREKVKMTIRVNDERGLPMPANLSLSVTNDQLLSFADDKSGNILSQLLLEQDIKEKVEEPAFYFDEKEKNAGEALDYLLMTSGWRRFTWKQVIIQELPVLSYSGETTIVKGYIYDAYTGKPVSNAAIKADSSALEFKAGELGEFCINSLDLSKTANIVVSAKGYYDQVQPIAEYNDNMQIYLYDTDNSRNGWRWMKFGAVAGGAMAVENFDGALQVPQAAVLREDAIGEDEMVIDEVAVDKADNNFELAEDEELNIGGEINEDINRAPLEKQADFKQDIQIRDIRANDEIEIAGRLQAFDAEVVAQQAQNQILYYRAREFAAPVYSKNEKVELRNDFRSTIYWKGDMEIDRTGKTEIEFYNSDDISSFRAVIEGIGEDGTPGRGEKLYYTQLPFAMSIKFPVEAVTEDEISVPLTLKNNTDEILNGNISINVPDGLIAVNKISEKQEIPANGSKILYLEYRVANLSGKFPVKISFGSGGLKDAFTQEINIVAKGFPVLASFSGKEAESEYSVNIENVVQGSVKAELTAYPSVVSDLLKGVESILQEPYGCFEQTSMTSYPNLLVMEYLKETDSEDAKLLAKAEGLLDKGYNRLVSYETKEKGYEWFGSTPAHEALTAYGLMQFNDMLGVYAGVDKKMIDRTAEWLFSRRDGKGGFKRNSLALDNYGSANETITNAYIVYALSEAGYKDIDKEVESAYNNAISSKDAYMLALLANTLFNRSDVKRAEELLDALYQKQASNGSWTGREYSITCSSGISLSIETTSLVVMAILKSKNPDQKSLNKAVEFLVSSRSGYGSFGNTQGTILALKALTEYTKFSKQISEDGEIGFYVDGREEARVAYKAGQKEPVVIDSLERYIGDGRHNLKVKFIGSKNPMPYSLAVGWNTFLPPSQKECKVGLETSLLSNTAKIGETVRLNVKIKNRTAEGLPSTIAIIGFPAGLSIQPWQLKELQEKKVFDYYEVKGNNVVLYYRQMKPSEIREVNFDLKAEIPGEYESPASYAYLYYTNEF